MPKLKIETISITNAAGETMTVRSCISVTATGEFRAQIPDNLAGDEGFRSCMEAARQANPGVKVDAFQRHTYFTCSALGPVIAALKYAGSKYIDVATVTDRVILYAFKKQVRYALDRDGNIVQGSNVTDEACTWPAESESDVLLQDDATLYMVGIWARAYDKITHRRGDSVVVQYQDIDGGDGPVAHLNAFETNASIPDKGTVPKGRGPRGNMTRADYTEIPYTDEAAEFFTRLLLSMCDLARRMDDFFGDKENVQLSIARGRPTFLISNQ